MKPSFVSRDFKLSQHTRWVGRTQRWLVLCGILATLFVGMQAVLAQEETEYPGGYTLLPLDPGPIRLLSMTVDISMRDDGDQAIAEVQAVFRVHNTDKANERTLTVAIPGYPAPKPAPSQLRFTVGGQDIATTPGFTQWWVADIDFKPDQRRNLVLTYSAPLGKGPFVSFSYPTDLTARLWPGALQSARVTLSFAEPPNPQSWLKLTPENYSLTAEAVTWSYDAVDPKNPIEYVFMRPTLWDELRAARQAAVAPGMTMQEHIALGDAYASLAYESSDAAIFDTYFPLAVAAYSQAQTINPDDSVSYLALSRLYRARAEQTQPANSAYVALSVNQLADALERGAQDSEIVEQVTDDFANLIARARLQGDFDTANSYFERLDDLAERSQIALETNIIAEERERLAIDWATTILRDEGAGPARVVVEQKFGVQAANPPGARFARLNSVFVNTETKPNLRTIFIEAATRVDSLTMVEELYQALEATGAANVTLASEQQPAFIIIDIPFGDGDELLNRQQTLAAAIPRHPEWTLLANVLSPQSLSWSQVEERWRTSDMYEENVSLVAAVAALGVQAQALDETASALDPSDPLDALRADIWRAEADVWRRLADNNRALFTLTLYPNPGAPTVQTWSLDPGEFAQMSGTAHRYKILPFVLVAVAVYALFVLITLLMWMASRRTKTASADKATKRGSDAGEGVA